MTRRKRRNEVEWLNKNSDFDTSLDADQAEFTALRFGSINIEEGVRDDRRVGALADSLQGLVPMWLERSSKLDETVGRIAQEMRRRDLLLDDSYPFSVSGNTLTYTGSKNGIYEFCLCATVTESLSKKPFNQLPVAFERLCCEISIILFGPRSTSVRTGWPRDRIDRLPRRAKDLFNKINMSTGEWVWDPDPDLPGDPSPTYFKELGLDLLAWIPMPDRRVGHFFVLGQCACGKSDWFRKRHEPDLAILRRWFKPMTVMQQPLKCFFVPFHIANSAQLADVTASCLALDRVRICLLAREDKRFESQEWSATYRALVGLVADTDGKKGHKSK